MAGVVLERAHAGIRDEPVLADQAVGSGGKLVFAVPPVPGDLVLNYPPPSEDQVVSCIRAELIQEGMEDYEYLWLLRRTSYILRTTDLGGSESDLLRRIDECLWDAWQWISDGTNRYKDTSYIGMCANLKSDQLPELADRFDRLRDHMGQTLQEAGRKGSVQRIGD